MNESIPDSIRDRIPNRKTVTTSMEYTSALQQCGEYVIELKGEIESLRERLKKYE